MALNFVTLSPIVSVELTVRKQGALIIIHYL